MSHMGDFGSQKGHKITSRMDDEQILLEIFSLNFFLYLVWEINVGK